MITREDLISIEQNRFIYSPAHQKIWDQMDQEVEEAVRGFWSHDSLTGFMINYQEKVFDKIEHPLLLEMNVAEIPPKEKPLAEQEMRDPSDAPPVFQIKMPPFRLISKDFDVPNNVGFAARRVAEGIEQEMVREILTYRNRLVQNLNLNPDQTMLGHLRTSVLICKERNMQNRFYPPYLLLVNPAWKDDGETYLQLSEIEGVGCIIGSWQVPTNQFALIRLGPETMRLVLALRPKAMQKEGKLYVVAAMLPQLRSDFDNNCGIVHCTVATES